MTNSQLLNQLNINEVIEASIQEIIKLLRKLSDPTREITLELQMTGLGCATQLNILRNNNPKIFEKYEEEAEEAWTAYYDNVQVYCHKEFK